jgi:O-succinylbenzoic acid--CoA ligase
MPNYDKYRNRPFLISRDSVLTYNLFWKNVNRLSRKLIEIGVKEGDIVAYFNKNSYMFPILFFALGKIGAIILPVNIRFPALQVIELLDELGVEHIVVSNLYIDEAFERNTKIILEDLIDINETYPEEDDKPFDIQNILDNDASIIFTSGSTGNPKAALHTYGNHYFSALGSNQNIELGKNDRWLAVLPTYHVGGISVFFRAYLAGATVVIPDTSISILENIIRNRVSHVSFVATQIFRMLDNPKEVSFLSKLKAILLGGSAMPAGLINKCFENGLKVFISYGSTEMSSQITATSPFAGMDELLTSGKILPYREVKIAEDGEILVKGKTLFKGYIQNSKTFSRIDSDDWYHTGDLGNINPNGLLTVYGRKDNMFISGGENIQPEEIEKELCKLDFIADAIVVAVPDSEFGRRPVAFLRVDKDTEINRQNIEKHLSKSIARYKLPLAYLPFPEKLNDLNLKIDRQHFTDLAKEYLGIS